MTLYIKINKYICRNKKAMEEIFNSNLTLTEKVELASIFAMEQVNKVIQKHIVHIEMCARLDEEAENRSKITSIKYEDTDLYRLTQKANAKRECIRMVETLSLEDLEGLREALTLVLHFPKTSINALSPFSRDGHTYWAKPIK
jgi:hypothetical protein